jgi:serine/threonine protein kinase
VSELPDLHVFTSFVSQLSYQVCRSEAPSPSSDIWSTMCLLIQMLSAKAPWEEYRHQGDGLLFVVSRLE